jgi:prepilin-type N-terminal cleavage/methylation domain-containing protein
MHKKAFTLIELLVTVAIIGLLTTIATASFVNAQQNSRDEARRVSVSSVATAVESYRIANGQYPGLSDASDGGNCAANTAYYYNPNATCPTPAFDPAPNWIPGLGKYLNPAAVERRYTGSTNGDPAVAGSFDSATGSPTGTTRTFSYKRTSTGYQVNTRLEKGTSVYSIKK